MRTPTRLHKHKPHFLRFHLQTICMLYSSQSFLGSLLRLTTFSRPEGGGHRVLPRFLSLETSFRCPGIMNGRHTLNGRRNMVGLSILHCSCRVNFHTGECVYIQVLGQPIVILGSLTAAHDLLNKRSTIYSSRPRLVSCIHMSQYIHL
jgi:hypothetical protein